MGEGNQTKQTKPKINQTEPSKKPSCLSFICELSLNAKFQLPRLCVSCISTQHNFFDKKKLGGENFFGENSFDEIFFSQFFLFRLKKNFGEIFVCNFCAKFLQMSLRLME